MATHERLIQPWTYASVHENFLGNFYRERLSGKDGELAQAKLQGNFSGPNEEADEEET